MFDSQGKADAIADTYEDQFSPNYDLKDEVNDRLVIRTINEFFSNEPTNQITPVKASEVRYFISKLNPRKSPGPDNISNRAIQNFPDNIIIYLTVIINSILKYHYFPKSWRLSIVSPIPKPSSNLTFADNYRPISLLSSLSKIAERVILDRINSFLAENNIIIPEQFGFRSHHSTTHQLLRVVEFASEDLQQRKPTGALFLDIAKAFDKVWHYGLYYKLIQLNMPDTLIHLLHSYLSRRKFTVRVNQTLSQQKAISSGIQQGSLLGATIFNLYINGIPRGSHTSLALYADDTAIIGSNYNINMLTSQMQHHIDTIENWFVRWKIRVNPSKCHAIFFSRTYSNPPLLYLNNSAIEWECSAKYLGVMLDRRLTWRSHVAYVKKRVLGAVENLRTLFFTKQLSIQNKILLYKSIIMPIALYASPVWSYAAKTNFEILEKVHSKTLRRIRGAFRFMSNQTIRNDLNVDTLKNTARRHAKNFYAKIHIIPNEIIAELPDYDHAHPSYRKRPRASMLNN